MYACWPKLLAHARGRRRLLEDLDAAHPLPPRDLLRPHRLEGLPEGLLRIALHEEGHQPLVAGVLLHARDGPDLGLVMDLVLAADLQELHLRQPVLPDDPGISELLREEVADGRWLAVADHWCGLWSMPATLLRSGATQK